MLPTTYTEVPFDTTKNNSYDIRFESDTKIQTTDDVTVVQSNSNSLILQYEFILEKCNKMMIEQQLKFDFKNNNNLRQNQELPDFSQSRSYLTSGQSFELYTTLNGIQFEKESKILFNPSAKIEIEKNQMYIEYESDYIIIGTIGKDDRTTLKVSNNEPIKIQWNITCDLVFKLILVTVLFKGAINVHVNNNQLYIDNITFKLLSVLKN